MRAEEFTIKLAQGALHPGRPLGYAEMIAAVLGSAGVVTDSGGLQKEAYVLGRVCTTLRSETEWTETLQGGWNVLAPEPDVVVFADVATRPAPALAPAAPYGDGRAAERVVRELEDRL